MNWYMDVPTLVASDRQNRNFANTPADRGEMPDSVDDESTIFFLRGNMVARGVACRYTRRLCSRGATLVRKSNCRHADFQRKRLISVVN